jgi:ubiquinone/menaquinone biosynthesis C-methylase UbiE
MKWKAYNELAWTEYILASPESYKEDAMAFIKALQRYIFAETPTLLHLGCGAGGDDFHFKQHFSVTGVDLSEGMLKIAKKTNPEITYINGDMRNVKLHKKFDAVVIPDSIMYMTNVKDLLAALKNAVAHMKPDVVLLVVAHTKEEFRNNNFAYTGENENNHITVFENNHTISYLTALMNPQWSI